MRNTRIGVINWDCSLPSTSYFGYYQTRTLSPSKFRSATPYYADILQDDKINYHQRNQEEFDKELAYAIEAGIDYFAYCFYADDGSKNYVDTKNLIPYFSYTRPGRNGEMDCCRNVYELNYARRMHETSKLRNKLKIALILIGEDLYSDKDMEELLTLLSKPYYECIDNRPLVYSFSGVNQMFFKRLNTACIEKGIQKPFIVPMYNGDPPEGHDFTNIDALSAYACTKGGIQSYEELAKYMIDKNDAKLSVTPAIIPLYTVGWDPSPRVNIPSPWADYANIQYARFASEIELFYGAKLLAQWICEHAKNSYAGHILTFAWNEFEEGGYICPTYTDNNTISYARLNTFKNIIKYFKETL